MDHLEKQVSQVYKVKLANLVNQVQKVLEVYLESKAYKELEDQ